MKSLNILGISRRWLGLGIPLVTALAAQASQLVTFMVDMAPETPGYTAVYVTGSFPEAGPWNTPNSLALINTTGTIWSNTFTLSDPAGTIEQVQFTDDTTGWAGIANYQFILGTTGDTTSLPGTQILPLQTWKAPTTWPAPSQQVTFKCDMSAQVLLGNFVNGSGTLLVAGDTFPLTWGNGNYQLTNDSSLLGSASNVYSGTFPVNTYLPNTIQYKFRMNGGWESIGNRSANITSSGQVLPLVYYNDNSPSDLLTAPVTVNFSVNVPNGSLDNGNNPFSTPYAFVKGTDTVWINGSWLNNGNWAGWGSLPSNLQMVQQGSSDIYTNSLVIPAAYSVAVTYKYSFNGIDDENGFQTNHVRDIRGPVGVTSYTMPLDQWSYNVVPPGTAYPNPGIASTNIVEPDFGYLTVGAPAGSNIPITWLGRQYVTLLNSSSVSGSWNNLGATDGTQSTNWPNAGGNQFFRLMKK